MTLPHFKLIFVWLPYQTQMKRFGRLFPFLVFSAIGLVARNNIPCVMGELLKPVSVTISASAKPTFLNKARKSFPGIAPPSHLNQLSTLAFGSSGNAPVKI